MLKTYIVVRSDMSKSQQAVQAGHALAELVYNAGKRKDTLFAKWIESDKTLILLKAYNKDHLETIHKQIEDKYIHQVFHEPDIGNEPTAIAIYPQEIKPSELDDLVLA